jgi:prepilin-type N-terminal cleavage/methylation domain-containing protein
MPTLHAGNRFGRLGDARRAGFTLIEIVLVVIIMGMMAAIGFSRVSAMISHQRVDSAAMAVGSQLQAAFALALRDRKPMQITFDTTKLQFKIADRAGNVFRLADMTGFNLNVSNVTLSRPLVEVYPEGLAQDSLSVTLAIATSDGTYQRRVRMTRGGMVQVR